jgi:hypothetical protein
MQQTLLNLIEEAEMRDVLRKLFAVANTNCVDAETITKAQMHVLREWILAAAMKSSVLHSL